MPARRSDNGETNANRFSNPWEKLLRRMPHIVKLPSGRSSVDQQSVVVYHCQKKETCFFLEND